MNFNFVGVGARGAGPVVIAPSRDRLSRRRRLAPALLALVCCLAAPLGLAEAAPRALDTSLFNQFIEEATARNSGHLAAQARAGAARAEAASVKRWQDPELMVGGMAARTMMRQDDGDVMLGVEQGLPIFGKESAARAAAAAEADFMDAEVELHFQNLRRDVVQAALGVALADEKLGFATRDLAWIATIEKVVQERFSLGTASQVELLKVRNEATLARELATTLASRRADAAALLNRLLGRGTHDPVEPLSLPAIGPEVPREERIFALASANDPRVRLAVAARAVSAARVKVAARESRPDASLEAATRHHSGSGDFRAAEFVVKLSLPWFNRSAYKSTAEAARQREQSTTLDFEEAVRETREEIQFLLTMIDSARREALAQRDEIIPRTERTLQLTEQFWRLGKAELRDVLDVNRMLVEARVKASEAIWEQHRRLVELILCCGLGDLEALEMITQSPSAPAQSGSNRSAP